jgi:hypothetical protein
MMKTKYIIAALSALMLSVSGLWAQNKDFREALKLQQRGMHSRASIMFDGLSREKQSADPEGYSVLSDVIMNLESYESRMNDFLKRNPHSSLASELMYRHAINLFEGQDYVSAAEAFSKVPASHVGAGDLDEYLFKKAYCELETGDMDRALLQFLDLTARPVSDFTAPAGFKIPEGAQYIEPEIYTPAGYTLVWRDEFNDPSLIMPDAKEWWYETAEPGWVNNELQTYVAGRTGDIITADVSDGTLKIRAIKSGNRVYSARVNTRKNWTYGYFEARLKLPEGKGTWPAFWMMPSVWSGWPEGGEIDIMEHVGCVPTEVSSSIHCKSYYHAIGTQKTAARKIPGVMDEFHTYALEWTPEYIKTYVDGKQLFYYNPDDYSQGRNANTWPFNKPFELKLNLAWGGDWGGMMGVDESCLPATYEIDYVRVFQK